MRGGGAPRAFTANGRVRSISASSYHDLGELLSRSRSSARLHGEGPRQVGLDPTERARVHLITLAIINSISKVGLDPTGRARVHLITLAIINSIFSCNVGGLIRQESKSAVSQCSSRL